MPLQVNALFFSAPVDDALLPTYDLFKTDLLKRRMSNSEFFQVFQAMLLDYFLPNGETTDNNIRNFLREAYSLVTDPKQRVFLKENRIDLLDAFFAKYKHFYTLFKAYFKDYSFKNTIYDDIWDVDLDEELPYENPTTPKRKLVPTFVPRDTSNKRERELLKKRKIY